MGDHDVSEWRVSLGLIGFPELLLIWRNISLGLSLVSISVAYLVHCFPFCLAPDDLAPIDIFICYFFCFATCVAFRKAFWRCYFPLISWGVLLGCWPFGRANEASTGRVLWSVKNCCNTGFVACLAMFYATELIIRWMRLKRYGRPCSCLTKALKKKQTKVLSRKALNGQNAEMKDRYSQTLSCAQLAKDRLGSIYLRLNNQTLPKLNELQGKKCCWQNQSPAL